MINTLEKLTLVAMVSAVAGVAVAASDPTGVTLGTSQGDFDITLNKEDKIIISNFKDMVLAQFIEDGGNGDYLSSQELCVGRAGASDDTALDYAITASNAKSAFFLNNGGNESSAKNNIGYEVYFTNQLLGVQQYGDASVAMLEHSISNDSFKTNLTTKNCVRGGTNSTLWIKADGDQVAAARVGVFTDTVTVTVAVN